MGIILIATIATSVAGVATYSGIYDLKIPARVLMAITTGGHVLSLSDDTSIASEANPAKSTVNATGKIVGSSSDGLSVVAQIASDFTVKGTAKIGGKTIRITGKRTFK